jgi:hypothetical protein
LLAPEIRGERTFVIHLAHEHPLATICGNTSERRRDR